VCKSGALTFEESTDALKRKTDEVARSVSREAEEMSLSPAFSLLTAAKRAQLSL